MLSWTYGGAYIGTTGFDIIFNERVVHILDMG
jgi:hypothetical protein